MIRVLRRWPLAMLGLYIGLSIAINLDGLRYILSGDKAAEHSWTAGLRQHPVAGPLVHYTGLLSGYGFFAPRVGSSCYLEIGFTDGSTQQIRAIDAASLFHASGYLRFRSFQHVFYELLPNTADGSHPSTTRQRIAQATVIAIGRRIAARRGATLAFCRLFVYNHPPLRHGSTAAQGQLIELYAKNFTDE